MTDLIHPISKDPGWHVEQPRRAAAFRAASRHSARVRVLKWAMLLGSIGGALAVFAISAIGPVRSLMDGFSMSGVTLDGSHVSLTSPRMAGFRQDGRPYEITARTMSQASEKSNAFNLDTVEGTIGLADKSTVRISAKSGLYDNVSGWINLSDHVHMINDTGVEFFMQAAHVDFKTSALISDLPVRVLTTTTTITADAMHVDDNGKRFVFQGRVHSTMISPSRAAVPADSSKETSR